MSSSNKNPSTKGSALAESSQLMKTLAFLLSTAGSMACMITYTLQDDRAMNDAYSARIESRN